MTFSFQRVRKAELQYSASLRSLSKYIADIVRHYGDDSLVAAAYIRQALSKYSDSLDPWARAVAKRMLLDVSNNDLRVWRNISRGLVREVESAPIGDWYKQLMEQQVGLIKSIPLEAAERVHDLVMKGMEDGIRPADIATHIDGVTRSRATLIANTETGRSATTLQASRAKFVGSSGFIWRTVKDAAVRKDHRILEGKFFAWDDPPVADQHNGARALPGCIYNCRCFAEPILPHGDMRWYKQSNIKEKSL